jgi:hypothetical protein
MRMSAAILLVEGNKGCNDCQGVIRPMAALVPAQDGLCAYIEN